MRITTNVHGVNADTEVTIDELQSSTDHSFWCITVDRQVQLFIDGKGADSAANTLAFLDKMGELRDQVAGCIAARMAGVQA